VGPRTVSGTKSSVVLCKASDGLALRCMGDHPSAFTRDARIVMRSGETNTPKLSHGR
jgi:hypothetical protein